MRGWMIVIVVVLVLAGGFYYLSQKVQKKTSSVIGRALDSGVVLSFRAAEKPRRTAVVRHRPKMPRNVKEIARIPLQSARVIPARTRQPEELWPFTRWAFRTFPNVAAVTTSVFTCGDKDCTPVQGKHPYVRP